MSNPKILIIGSTGVLGSKLLSFCKKNKIKIDTICCFKNSNKLSNQKKSFSIKNSFVLSEQHQSFINHIKKNKYKIIYFLDYGIFSLRYAEIILKNNKYSTIAIANKEMLIAGGSILIKMIKKTNNMLVPLDSEHFSLQKIKFKNSLIKNIYITASGGPFYFYKNININKVSINDVLNHPKWKMGLNNSIDSSNFINKVLEVYELSHIYEIELSKINFLVSKEAYLHSIVVFNDNTISLNCFDNDMLITLTSPLKNFFNFKLNLNKGNYIYNSNLRLEKFNDKRFTIQKYLKKFLSLEHDKQIKLLILNKIAQKQYLEGSLKYSQIINFIASNLNKRNKKINLYNFKSILNYVKDIENDFKNFI